MKWVDQLRKPKAINEAGYDRECPSRNCGGQVRVHNRIRLVTVGECPNLHYLAFCTTCYRRSVDLIYYNQKVPCKSECTEMKDITQIRPLEPIFGKWRKG